MLSVQDVKKSYRDKGLRRYREVVKGVSFSCAKGESIGIIGESGSGKSTLGRMILGIEKPNHGRVEINGQCVCRRDVRQGQMSAVFQNYKSSLHPYFNVEQILKEPLKQLNLSTEAHQEEMIRLLEEVGLDESFLKRYPQMMSGGEAQRVAIARAISTKPDYLVLDEAISALDMSIQTQILDLLVCLREEYQLSYIFITHDIQAATYLCDRLLIFKEGGVQETLSKNRIHEAQHDYTRALLEKQLI